MFGIKKGFTLSEVLITLTVIGIIATMTIPLLSTNHKKLEYATKLKKFYNTMNNAIEQAEMDYNLPVGKWAIPATTKTDDFFNNYLKDYIRYNKIEDVDISNFNGAQKVYLPDGTTFAMYSLKWSIDGDRCMSIIYDVNGDSPPTRNFEQNNDNNHNSDIFYFTISTNGPTDGIPTGFLAGSPSWQNNNVDTLRTNCSTNYKYCALYLQKNGWVIDRDYPRLL